MTSEKSVDVSKSDDEQNSPICPIPSGKSDIATENLQKALRSTHLLMKDRIEEEKIKHTKEIRNIMRILNLERLKYKQAENKVKILRKKLHHQQIPKYYLPYKY